MVSVLFYLSLLLVYVLFAIYAERKVSAFIQDRLGPMEVGPYGMVQTVADLLKLLQKEDIVPALAGRSLFRLAPVLLFIVVFTGFAFFPVASPFPGSATSTGVFLLMAILSLDVITIVMAGWMSNNKYSTLGAFRSAAQIISYEVPLGLSVLCVCMLTGTLNLNEIAAMQAPHSGNVNYLFGMPALGVRVDAIGGILTWTLFQQPILIPVWIIFFISTLAECNRAPFDLPEAESELVAGFHTEYSGFRWAILFLAEYGLMLLVSLLGALLFFGGWNSPLPNLGSLRLADWTNGAPGTLSLTIWGAFWLVSKALLLVIVQMWIRWTYPRLRVDQLMQLCWKVLTPLALIFVILCGLIKLVIE